MRSLKNRVGWYVIVLVGALLGCSPSSPGTTDGGVTPDRRAVLPDSRAVLPDSQVLVDQGAVADTLSPLPSWAVVAGGTRGDRLLGVAVDHLGNTIVVGHVGGDGTMGQHTLTAKAREPLIASIDRTGHVKWVTIGEHDAGAGFNDATDIAVDNVGNSYVVGEFSGTMTLGTIELTAANIGFDAYDIFVAKLDPAGRVVWAKSFGGEDLDKGESIAVDTKGNVIITGGFRERAEFGSSTVTSAGSDGVFVAKLSNDGEVLWARNAHGPACWADCAVATDRADNIYLVTDYQGTITVGPTRLIAEGDREIAVVKYDAAGAVQWATSAGGPEEETPTDIAVDGAGNVYITGDLSTRGKFASFGSILLRGTYRSNAFLAQLTPQGAFSWAIAAKSGLGTGVDVDAAGNGCLVGYYHGTFELGGAVVNTKGENDTFIGHFNAKGELRRLDTFGTSDVALRGRAVARDALGHCHVVGTTSGTVTIGGKTVEAGFGDRGHHDGIAWHSDP